MMKNCTLFVKNLALLFLASLFCYSSCGDCGGPLDGDAVALRIVDSAGNDLLDSSNNNYLNNISSLFIENESYTTTPKPVTINYSEEIESYYFDLLVSSSWENELEYKYVIIYSNNDRDTLSVRYNGRWENDECRGANNYDGDIVEVKQNGITRFNTELDTLYINVEPSFPHGPSLAPVVTFIKR